MLSSDYSTTEEVLQVTAESHANQSSGEEVVFHWRREVAMYYAEHFGWLCLPAVGKRPICRWNVDELPELPTLDYLRDVWTGYKNHNIAVLTGRRSRVCVADVDPRHGGEIESLWNLGWPQDTVIARSGSGGYHVYVACPEEGLPTINNYIEGIEFKADGALVIAPPSNHATTGLRYEWLPGHDPMDGVTVKALPDKLVADILFTRKIVEPYVPREPYVPTEDQLARLAKRAPSFVQQAIQRVLAGNGRNNTGYWLACRLRDLHVSDETALACMRAYQREVEHWNG